MHPGSAMKQRNPAPPPDSSCLFRVCSSSQKGGTLFNVVVVDYETHKALLHSLVLLP